MDEQIENPMEEWVEKYRPSTIDDIIMEEHIRNKFKKYLDKGTCPNCTLHGFQGIGKTSLAKIIANNIPDATVLFISASVESGIDVIRNKVIEFINRVGFGGVKIVILDEVNRLSSDAQESLRTPIEECIDDTRFILTTNTLSQTIGPLQSRCIPIGISAPVKKIYERLLWVLEQESITVGTEEKQFIATNILQKHYPDIRLMIKHLEFNSISGVFEMNDFNADDKIDKLVEYILSNCFDIVKCREEWIKNEVVFNKDYIQLAHKIFNIIQTAEQMEVVAENIYKMSQVLDKEIQFTAMIIALSKVILSR